jgi:hypothetical protein
MFFELHHRDSEVNLRPSPSRNYANVCMAAEVDEPGDLDVADNTWNESIILIVKI